MKQENREINIGVEKILVPKPIINNDKDKEKVSSNKNANKVNVIEKETDVKENKAKNIEHKNNIFKL